MCGKTKSSIKRLTATVVALLVRAAFAAGPVAELYGPHLTLLNDFDDGTVAPSVGGLTGQAKDCQFSAEGVGGSTALACGSVSYSISAAQKVFDTARPGSVVFWTKLTALPDPPPAKEPSVYPFMFNNYNVKRLFVFRQNDLNWGSAPLSVYYEYTRPEGGRYVARSDISAGSLKQWTVGGWHLVAMTHTADGIALSFDGSPFKETMLTERMGSLGGQLQFSTYGASSTTKCAIDDCAVLDFKLSDEQVKELYDEYAAVAEQAAPTADAPRVTEFATVAATASSYSITVTVENPASAAVTVRFAAEAHPVNSQPATTSQTAEIPAGESRTFTLTGPVLGEEKVTSDVSVTSADGGTTYFRRHRVFAPNAPEPEWMRDPTAMSFRFAYYPSANTVHAAVDVSGCEDGDAATAVMLRILRKPGLEEIASASFPATAGGTTEIFWRDLPDLADGDYVCRATVAGVGGALADQPFVRKHFEWEGNRYGLSGAVPAPFKPVKSEKGKVKNEEVVSVILREHTVDETAGLWKQVTAAGKDILARPMALVSGNRTIEQSEQSNNTSLSATAEWDVDGLMLWRLTLKPGHYEPMSLEIPMKPERARLYHACTDGIRINKAGELPSGTGRVWSSVEATHNAIIGNYVPYLWVGGPLRGIAVFGENDRGWVVDSTPCQEIVREADGTVVIRLNLIQTACDLTEERTIKIGFQATPVKPMMEGWRAVGNGTLLGACYYWGGYTASEDVEPFDGTDEYFRVMGEERRSGRVDTDYLKRAVESYPYTQTPGTPAWESKHSTIQAHFQSGHYNAMWAGLTGNLVFYTNGRGVHYGDAKGQGATYCNEWNRYEYMNRSFTLDSSAAYDLDPVASYRDYATWWYRKMMETGACDHLYWDDVFCQSSFNLVQTDAYRLPNGRIQPSSGIFNMRELVKRCAVLQAEMGRDTRGNWVHMTNTALAPVLSFAGVNYDWEDIADERPFQERYSRGYILATAIGRQFGNRVGIMGYFSKDDPDTYAWLAHTGVGVMLTHELRWNASGHDEYVAAHKFLCDWGYRTDAVEVWNYWDEDVAYPLEVTGVESTSIALAKATSGEAMVCVSSFASTNGTVRIRPDMEALGLNEGPWRACHALTDEEIPVVDGAVELQLARYDWALVRINGPRKVEPLDPESLPEGYDELVEFVEADGAQWIDTGIDPNPKTTRIRARFVPLEILPASSASDRIVLFGVNGTKGNAFDSKNCNAVLGYGSDNGYQVCPLWTGSSGGGYHYPGAGNYTVGKGYEIDFREASVKSSAYVNTGFRCGGYNAKYDGRLGKTLFLGDINDAGRGLYTETSFGGWRRGKVRWLGLTATDGEGRLVADFRPAKRDGVAGFWDAVSGRFFRSRGDRDFAAPQYVRWTGGTNFADDVVASVPPGVTVRASYADVAALNRLAGIRLEGVTSGLVFTNGDRNATLYAPFSGRGRVVNAESNPKSSCTLTFEGDSSFFAGEFLVTNAATAAKFAPYAFGVTNRVAVNNASGGGSDTRRFRLESAVHSNEFHVVRASNLFFGVNDATVTGPLYLDLPGGLTFHGNNQSLSLSGPIVTTVTNDASTVYLNSNTYLLGGEKAVKSFARKRVQASNTVRVGCPLRFLPQPFSYVIYDNCSFSWNEGATVKFERANVFEDDVFVLANYAAPNSSTRSGHLNLNGFDQRIGTLGVYCVSGFRVAEQWNANMRIGSETPATLTVRKTCRNDVAANLYHGTLAGAVSFRLDSTDATAGRIRFNCPGSDTTGFLEASRGTIEVLETASFPNLGGLVLSGTGEIRLLTSAVGDANPDFSVAFAAPADGARLCLGDGVQLVAKTVFDGRRWLKPGVYGAAAAGDVRANAHLSGTGTLRVLERGGGPAPGFLLLIR